ncbi:MAG: rhodanese-like domain-containing protein [Cyclobacteriaceae bacterium]|nr:rhodanese-like domain-containing protein [Cyclobacteriaceae bacterium]
MVKEITVQELNQLVKNKEDFQLIDVREEFEHDISNIGGRLIPLGKVYFHLSEIEKDKKVVIYCRSGRRSADAVKLLQDAAGLENLYNLKGGILAWSAEIDNTVSTLL